jgi:hypothetical protein
MVLDAVPQPFDVTVTSGVLEAMMIAVAGGAGELTHDDLLDMIVSAGLEPRVLYPNGFRRKSRFAFVIHPLSQQFFSTVEPLAIDPGHAPRFSAFIYTADLLIPIGAFGLRGAYDPVGWTSWVADVLIAAGWILATALVAGVSRRIGRD